MVSGLGPKAYEQAVGFLRIREGAIPSTPALSIRSYPVAEAVLQKASLSFKTPPSVRKQALDELLIDIQWISS